MRARDGRAGAGRAEPGPGARLLRRLFVPPSDGVPPEYWACRGGLVAASVLATLRAALTAQAHMVAIGVGDPDATPLQYLVVAETNAAVARLLGLLLAARLPASLFAMHAKRTKVLHCTLGKLAAVFPVLLLRYPRHLAWISLAETLFNLPFSLAAAPAQAALYEHFNKSPDPARRALLAQQNGNQDKLKTLLHMLVRYWCVFVALVEPPNLRVVCALVLVLGVLEALVEAWVALGACPNTFSRLRLGLAQDLFLRGLPLSPGDVNRLEPLAPSVWDGRWQLGCELRELADEADLGVCLLGLGGGGGLAVVLRDLAPRAQLEAGFYAHLVAARLRAGADLRAALRHAAVEGPGLWRAFAERAETSGWRLDACVLHCGPWRLKAEGDIWTQERRAPGQAPEVRAFRRAAGGWAAASEAPARAWLGGLYACLLPVGFPDSVAPEYMAYQLWDTLQVMMDDLRSILISNAGLIGQGVGVAGMTALDTLWVDFRVQLASTLHALLMGGVDAGKSAAEMKRWRVYNAVLSYFNTTCTLVQGMVPQYRIHWRLAQTVAGNSISPFGGGAGEALVLHLSRGSQDPAFRADVAAKEGNQDRALGLALVGVRFWLLARVGARPQDAWVAVAVLSIGHIALNYLCARILVLESLNAQRLHLCFLAFRRGEPLGPAQIARQERLLGRGLGLQLGVRLQDLAAGGAEQAELAEAYRAKPYVLGAAGAGFRAVLKAGSGWRAQLEAAVHCELVLAEPPARRQRALAAASGRAEAEAARFLAALERAGWPVGRPGGLQLGAGSWRLDEKRD